MSYTWEDLCSKFSASTIIFCCRYQNAYMIAPIEEYWQRQQISWPRPLEGVSLLVMAGVTHLVSWLNTAPIR